MALKNLKNKIRIRIFNEDNLLKDRREKTHNSSAFYLYTTEQ